MATKPGPLVSWAESILAEAKAIEAYHAEHNVTIPSFDESAYDEQAFPAALERRRAVIMNACEELSYLVQGPRKRVQNHFASELTCLDVIHRFQIAPKVPKDGKISYTELSKLTGLSEAPLRRVLRRSAASHIFAEHEPGFISHSAASRLIIEDSALANWIGAITQEILPANFGAGAALQKWPLAEEATQTGYSVANNITGETMFQHMAKFPERAAQFAESMKGLTKAKGNELSHVVDNYPWGDIGSGTVVDLGGSTGALAFAIAEKYPDINFVVQDLPSTVAAASERPGVKVKFVGASFFEEEPIKSADVYMSRWCFHDWPDKYCLKILNSLIPALKPGARILIIDHVLAPIGDTSVLMADHRRKRNFDVNMMSLINAMEREESEWKALFKAADPRFRWSRIIQPQGSNSALLEAVWEPTPSASHSTPTRPTTTASNAIHEDVKGKDFTLAATEIPPGYFRSTKFLGSMFAIGSAFGCGVAGFTFAAPILSYIDEDIGPDPNLTWVALSYLLTSSIGLIIVGRLTDIFGRRWFFITGSAIATIGSVVCSTAPSITALIAGETLVGLGASVQLSYAFVVSEIVPMKWRFLAQGYVFLWGIPFSGFAPAISYAFVFQTSVGWRGVYYLLIAVNAASTLAWILFYHPPDFQMKHGVGRKMEFLRHFDYIGTVMVTLGLLLFLMGISWGGTLHPWDSAHTISAIVVGALLLIAFFLWEAYAPLKEPLLPLHLFRNRGWNVSVLLWSLGASTYYALAILWPSMVAVLYRGNHGFMWVGWISCLSNCGILFGEYCGAWWKRRTDIQIRVVFVLGSAFLAAMAACGPGDVVMACVLCFLATAFIGWNEILNSAVATIVIDDQREIGTATGAGGSARSTISTICSTTYTVVLSNRLAATIPARVPPALVAAGLPASSVTAFLKGITTGSFDAVSGITPSIIAAGLRAYQEASAAAYKTVFLTTLAFSGVGIIVTYWCPNVDKLLVGDVSITLGEKEVKDLEKEKA